MQGVLCLVMAVYLAISIPPVSLSLRYTLTCLLVGENAPYEPVRHYLVTSVPTFAALAIALFFPQVHPTCKFFTRIVLVKSHCKRRYPILTTLGLVQSYLHTV